MKTYVYYYCEFPGRWLGGHAVLCASDKLQAIDMVVHRTQSEGLPPISKNDVTVIAIGPAPSYEENSTFVVFHDGDY